MFGQIVYNMFEPSPLMYSKCWELLTYTIAPKYGTEYDQNMNILHMLV